MTRSDDLHGNAAGPGILDSTTKDGLNESSGHTFHHASADPEVQQQSWVGTGVKPRAIVRKEARSCIIFRIGELEGFYTITPTIGRGPCGALE